MPPARGRDGWRVLLPARAGGRRWLDSLRALPQFAAIVERAETRHRQALISFLSAEGDRVLGVPQPV